VLGLIWLLPKLPALGRYVTADEPMYIREAGGFYFAVSHGLWGETNRVIQPGVPVLWLGSAAYQTLFPEFTTTGELWIADLHLVERAKDQGLNVVDLLVMGRLFALLLQTALLMLVFYFAADLIGPAAAGVGVLIYAFDPFMFGHTRLLATDGLLAGFMLLAVISWMHTLEKGNAVSLLVAGVSTGLSILTKATGVFLLLFVPIAVFIHSFRKSDWRLFLRLLLVWGAVAVVTVFILWPVLWTDPLGTAENLLNFTIQSASSELNSNTFFQGEVIPGGDLGGWRYAHFYPLTFLFRTTPVVLIGLAFAAAAFGIPDASGRLEGDARKFARFVLWAAILFTVFMSLSAKKFDRYLTPAYPLLDLLAGLGWVWMAGTAASRFGKAKRWKGALAGGAIIGLAVLAQASYVSTSRPYYLSYYNPLLGGADQASRVMAIGWGEGVDQAARYLNTVPGISGKSVFAWYAAALNLHFDGRAKDLPISTVIDDPWFEEMVAADYAVIYIHQRQRWTSPRLLDYLEGEVPLHVVRIAGIDYAWIYDMEAVRAAKEQSVLPGSD